ncbi:hypothetical protein ACIGW4_25905 [Streptomyces sp. NPDC053513]|uniref:Uncharacterized protein n=1 Tax=Streptomyces litmocidini TaxID=67318 RepID=A0ABW7U4Z8_9ACTN
MALDTMLDLLQALPHLYGPTGAVTAALMLARTAVRHASLIWLTRGTTPQERALILASMRGAPRSSWRDRCRRLAHRLRRRR